MDLYYLIRRPTARVNALGSSKITLVESGLEMQSLWSRIGMVISVCLTCIVLIRPKGTPPWIARSRIVEVKSCAVYLKGWTTLGAVGTFRGSVHLSARLVSLSCMKSARNFLRLINISDFSNRSPKSKPMSSSRSISCRWNNSVKVEFASPCKIHWDSVYKSSFYSDIKDFEKSANSRQYWTNSSSSNRVRDFKASKNFSRMCQLINVIILVLLAQYWL